MAMLEALLPKLHLLAEKVCGFAEVFLKSAAWNR